MEESLCAWHARLHELHAVSAAQCYRLYAVNNQDHLLYDLLRSLLRATDVPKDSFDQVKMYATCDGHPEVQQVPAHSPGPKSKVPPWLMLSVQDIALGHSPRLGEQAALSHQLGKQAQWESRLQVFSQ